MEPLKTFLFSAFLIFAGFNAGAMATLQIQHYAIYPKVGKEAFAEYVSANNAAALVPAIIPAMLLLLISLVLIVIHPRFMSFAQALAALLLNLIALGSTFRWQRPLQEEMARTGYGEEQVRRLIATNWIRTAAFLFQALLAGAVAWQAF